MKRFKNKLKLLLIIMIGIMLIISLLLISKYIGKKKYVAIEKKYLEVAEFIYENNVINLNNNLNKIIITRKEMNSLLEKPILDYDCNGYVIIYPSNQGAKYEVYITCGDNYTTNGFDERLLY